MKALLFLLCLSLAASGIGCTGLSIPSLRHKPYTYLKGGDQFGRDQLANRWLVAEKMLPIKGKDVNEITTLLGQPQQVSVVDHKISEDWYFIYYKNYKVPLKPNEGSFLVRFYHEQVVDVVKLT